MTPRVGFLLLFIVCFFMSNSRSPNSTSRKFISKKTESSSTVKEVLKNDPNIQKNWGLFMTKGKQAWQITKGAKRVVVAVIDTGVEIEHEALKKNIWVNKGETGVDGRGRDKRYNGVDDDKNGYIDDVHGWNFVHNNKSVNDKHGHGTHIAGIIAAERNSKSQVNGIAPQVSIMVLKYFNRSDQSQNIKNTISAIHYAVENGAHIINYSGGGSGWVGKEREAIEEAQKKGVLFVAAAGNFFSDIEKKKYYPASYELDNIISVAGQNKENLLVSSSNYGKGIDIIAPGKEIYSSYLNNKYVYLTGTSQATAFVTGVAALLKSYRFEEMGYKQLKDQILSTGDYNEKLKGKVQTQRHLNAFKALAIVDNKFSVTGSILPVSLQASQNNQTNSTQWILQQLPELLKQAR